MKVVTTDESEFMHVTPILPPNWDATALDALNAFPAGLKFVLQKWQEGRGAVRGMNVLGTLAHHPPLAKAFLTFNAHVAGASTLSQRTRELAVLRASWLRRCEYEFVQHVILGERAGLQPDDIERVKVGPHADGWDQFEAAVIRAVDELHFGGLITSFTWCELAGQYTNQQMLELIFLVGCYDVLAKMIESVGVELEPGVAGLDDTMRSRMFAAPIASSS